MLPHTNSPLSVHCATLSSESGEGDWQVGTMATAGEDSPLTYELETESFNVKDTM